MKKNIMTLLLLLLAISCNKDFSLGVVYKITNISTHLLELKVFHFISQSKGADIDSVYTLTSASTIIDSYEDRTNDRKVRDDYLPSDPFYNADSAQIIFDGSYRISYKQTDSNPRNILHLSSYTGGKTEKRTFEYQYYITDEDYKNAVKIE